LALLVVVAVTAGCRSLPRREQVAKARTHIQTLKFERPKRGEIDARAELVIYNPGEVKTYIDSIDATLYRGEAVLGRVIVDEDHKIRPWDSKAIWLRFEDISVARLETAIGRPLAKSGIEDFEIGGVIIYETRDGYLRHTLEKFRIGTILGPKGSGM